MIGLGGGPGLLEVGLDIEVHEENEEDETVAADDPDEELGVGALNEC